MMTKAFMIIGNTFLDVYKYYWLVNVVVLMYLNVLYINLKANKIKQNK